MLAPPSVTTGEQFPVDDATFAVDSLTVDWNAQSVKSAQSYIDMMPFSCRGLIDQLSSDAGEQFTGRLRCTTAEAMAADRLIGRFQVSDHNVATALGMVCPEVRDPLKAWIVVR